MSHSLPNTFPSWPENLKSELIASIGDYMRQQDADYDVDAFADYFKPHLDEGQPRDKLGEILISEASWEEDQVTPFLTFLFNKIEDLAPKTESKPKAVDANTKKRERDASEELETAPKKAKLVEDADLPNRTGTPSSQDDKNDNDASKSESKPLTAAERLAKVKAQRAERGPIGGVTREANLEKFDSRRDKDRKFTSMTSYSSYNDDESDEDDNNNQRGRNNNGRRDPRSMEVSTSRNGRRDNQREDRENGRGRRRDAEDGDDENGGRKQKPDRCAFYPNCTKGDDCPFFHPTQPCRNYPNCSKGDHCDFVHPPCKFGDNCQRRPMCPFAHSLASERNASAYPMNMMNMMHMGMGMMGPPCKNGFACTKKPNCSFQHPAVLCRFGTNCRNGHMCMFSHAPACRNGAECTIPHCKFGHPGPQIAPKVDPNAVSNLSETLPLTPKEDASPIVEEVEETAS